MTSYSRVSRRKNFRKAIQCKICTRGPDETTGEKIDAWLLENKSGRISLTCPSCAETTND